MVQEVIVSERRFQYEAEVKADPQNYDSWFDYARLEESAGDPEKVLPPPTPPAEQMSRICKRIEHGSTRLSK